MPQDHDTQELPPSPPKRPAADETLIQPVPGRGGARPACGDANASPSAAPEPPPREFSDTVHIPAMRPAPGRRGWLRRLFRRTR